MTPVNKVRHGYHDLLRPEIIRLIPTNVKNILDLGCGTGLLGKALKSRQPCHVTGIEINTEAAELAKKNLDLVYSNNLNRFDPSHIKQKYDCIVLADILEHLIFPWQVLKKFSSALSDDGVVVASIPNIAHPWIISQLQKGLFRYDNSGILDSTHLRFFTKTTIFQLFCKAGLKIISAETHPRKENPIQFLVKAVKPKLPHANPQVTILTCTLNAWSYTTQFLSSVKARTHVPHKIIAIDNGSSDETVKELRNDLQIYHVENTCNLGFGRGFNIGMSLIDTPYFMICNNDIVVTDWWIQRMLSHIQDDKSIVAIGPLSNYVSGPQLIKDVPYNSVRTLAQYALDRLKWATPEILYTDRIVFFCTLFNSSVISRIGYLDERFDKGNFEDDDYCMRIASNKLKAAIDNTVFVHHYGSMTFQANLLDYKSIFEENKKRFQQKWHPNEV